MNYLLVALGGAFGSVLRYWAGFIFSFPFGTLTVNILGSLAMGLAYGFLLEKGLERASLLLMVGFLGGFTTFSSFANENLSFVRSGDYTMLLAYSMLSLTTGIIMVYLGILIDKYLH